MKKLYQIAKKSFLSMVNHDGIEFAGYLSFLTIITLFPFVILLTLGINKATIILHETIEVTDYKNYIYDNILQDLLNGIRPFIEEAVNIKNNNEIISIICLSSLWTASSAIEGLRLILNRAYRIDNIPHYILRRLIAIIQFIIMIIVNTMILMTITIIPWIKKMIILPDDSLSKTSLIMNNMHIPLSILLLFIVINSTYYFIPNHKTKKWSYHIPGSLLVLLLWSTCAKGLKVYIHYSVQFNIIYGSIAGIITTMLFFYLLHLCIIYGAEFNYMFNLTKDKEYKP